MTSRTFLRVAAPAIAILAMPALLVGALCLTWLVDVAIEHHRVSRFIDEHRPLVRERLVSPTVHAFSLTHDPTHWGTLRVHLDVDDRTTHDRIETELQDAIAWRMPVTWDAHLRSDEVLGNDFGLAAEGMGLAFAGLSRFLVCSLLALVGSGVLLWRLARLQDDAPSRTE